MKTDRKKLEKMKSRILCSEGNTYSRMKKINVLEKLIISTDEKTGKLLETIIIPRYEHDGAYLKETLNKLGYSPGYAEEYNHFYKTTCYIINL